METGLVLGPLELRAKGGRIFGSFPYNRTATRRDRGRVRKESVRSRAFRFAVEEPEREIHLLSGHEYSKPLASKRAGTLKLADTDDALEFEAALPAEGERPTWMRDTVLAVRGGLAPGVSPGFIVPPRAVVPDAEELIPEPGNPDVLIRRINHAVLIELSIVTRPAYPGTSAEVRALMGPSVRRRRGRLWL